MDLISENVLPIVWICQIQLHHHPVSDRAGIINVKTFLIYKIQNSLACKEVN
jgi:hypothetical protein